MESRHYEPQSAPPAHPLAPEPPLPPPHFEKSGYAPGANRFMYEINLRIINVAVE